MMHDALACTVSVRNMLEHEAIAPIQRLHANLLFMAVEVGILWDCSPFSSSLVLVLSSTRYGFTSTFLCLFNTFD